MFYGSIHTTHFCRFSLFSSDAFLPNSCVFWCKWSEKQQTRFSFKNTQWHYKLWLKLNFSKNISIHDCNSYWPALCSRSWSLSSLSDILTIFCCNVSFTYQTHESKKWPRTILLYVILYLIDLFLYLSFTLKRVISINWSIWPEHTSITLSSIF